MKADFEITIQWDAEPIVVQDDSDEDHVRSLMMDFRMFYAQNEDIRFPRIAGIIESTPGLAQDLLDANRINQKSWDWIGRTPSTLVTLDDKAYRPSDWLDVWLHGHLFHIVPKYAEVYDKLDDVNRAIARFEVHNMVLLGFRVLHAERNLIEDGFRRGCFAA